MAGFGTPLLMCLNLSKTKLIWFQLVPYLVQTVSRLVSTSVNNCTGAGKSTLQNCINMLTQVTPSEYRRENRDDAAIKEAKEFIKNSIRESLSRHEAQTDVETLVQQAMKSLSILSADKTFSNNQVSLKVFLKLIDKFFIVFSGREQRSKDC